MAPSQDSTPLTSSCHKTSLSLVTSITIKARQSMYLKLFMVDLLCAVVFK